MDYCVERYEVCFTDDECCEPYVCDSLSLYCDKKSPSNPSPTPPGFGGSYSFSYEYDYFAEEDELESLWGGWDAEPSASGKGALSGSVSKAEAIVQNERQMNMPTSEEACKDALDEDMKVNFVSVLRVL